MKQKITLLIFLLFLFVVDAQIIGDQAPFVLTIDQLKNWTQNGSTADPELIATENLAPRFVNTSTQFDTSLNNNMEIAYLPDGMNNFANYSNEQSQFNLFNFTNWAYIDKLVWFGGTADQTVQIPSAPWVNTAHKNGVKVYGNVFFAPNAFGGSTATLQNFLEQDINGDFVVIPIMVNIMQYYNFDGWFINEETGTNSSTAQLMYQFLRDLTAAVEALGKDVMWYDAMTLNGQVSWQNVLNSVNSPFVQNDEDGNASNGFEQRVSSSIFLNFFWSGSTPPLASRSRASTIGRSKYEVFTGVDIWPGRNQGNFETSGNTWMGWLEQENVGITSLGLFATNCIYNNSIYSNFNNNPNDYANFYSQERHMFAGADRNPSTEDVSGFKGYANWVPAASTITQIPFETNFNTGHGFKKFTEGTETSSSQWHNLNEQDILPTWQFAFSETNLSGNWDFDMAYNGGSSLEVSGNLNANTPVDLTLYKIALLLDTDSTIDLVYNYDLPENSQLELLLTFADSPTQVNTVDVSPSTTGWISSTNSLSAFQGRELAKIGLRFSTTQTINNYNVNIGNIKIHNMPPLSVAENTLNDENSIVIAYPKASDHITIYSNLTNNPHLDFTLYTIQGREVSNHTIDQGSRIYNLSKTGISQGMYIITFKTIDGDSLTKKIIIR